MILIEKERKGEREKEENKLVLHLETKEISWNSEGIIIEVGKTGFFFFYWTQVKKVFPWEDRNL